MSALPTSGADRNRRRRTLGGRCGGRLTHSSYTIFMDATLAPPTTRS
jgi:hypothetical protein